MYFTTHFIYLFMHAQGGYKKSIRIIEVFSNVKAGLDYMNKTVKL